METKRPRWVIAQLAMGLLIVGSMPGLAFELDERLLGLSKVPYTIGQTVAADRLGHCVDTPNGLQMCPIGQVDGFGFAILIERVPAGGNVRAVLSLQRCTPDACAGQRDAVIERLEQELGAAPQQLEGGPTWRDSVNGRDLMVDVMQSSMVSIMLAELPPDAEPAPN